MEGVSCICEMMIENCFISDMVGWKEKSAVGTLFLDNLFNCVQENFPQQINHLRWHWFEISKSFKQHIQNILIENLLCKHGSLNVKRFPEYIIMIV